MDILPATTITTTHHPDLSKSILITHNPPSKNTLRQEHSGCFYQLVFLSVLTRRARLNGEVWQVCGYHNIVEYVFKVCTTTCEREK